MKPCWVPTFKRYPLVSSGTVKLEGVFPGYEGVYTYSLKLNSGE